MRHKKKLLIYLLCLSIIFSNFTAYASDNNNTNINDNNIEENINDIDNLENDLNNDNDNDKTDTNLTNNDLNNINNIDDTNDDNTNINDNNNTNDITNNDTNNNTNNENNINKDENLSNNTDDELSDDVLLVETKNVNAGPITSENIYFEDNEDYISFFTDCSINGVTIPNWTKYSTGIKYTGGASSITLTFGSNNFNVTSISVPTIMVDSDTTINIVGEGINNTSLTNMHIEVRNTGSSNIPTVNISNIKFIQNSFTNSWLANIRLNNGFKYNISNCNFEVTDDTAAYSCIESFASYGPDVTIDHCNFSSTVSHGTALNFEASSWTYTDSDMSIPISITNCTFDKLNRGIYIKSQQPININSCDFTNCSYAIFLEPVNYNNSSGHLGQDGLTYMQANISHCNITGTVGNGQVFDEGITTAYPVIVDDCIMTNLMYAIHYYPTYSQLTYIQHDYTTYSMYEDIIANRYNHKISLLNSTLTNIDTIAYETNLSNASSWTSSFSLLLYNCSGTSISGLESTNVPYSSTVHKVIYKCNFTGTELESSYITGAFMNDNQSNIFIDCDLTNVGKLMTQPNATLIVIGCNLIGSYIDTNGACDMYDSTITNTKRNPITCKKLICSNIKLTGPTAYNSFSTTNSTSISNGITINNTADTNKTICCISSGESLPYSIYYNLGSYTNDYISLSNRSLVNKTSISNINTGINIQSTNSNTCALNNIDINNCAYGILSTTNSVKYNIDNTINFFDCNIGLSNVCTFANSGLSGSDKITFGYTDWSAAATRYKLTDYSTSGLAKTGNDWSSKFILKDAPKNISLIKKDKSSYYIYGLQSDVLVTYDYTTNGGTSISLDDNTVIVGHNTAIDVTPTATKEGYTFVGWSTNKDAHTKSTSIYTSSIQNELTVYAIFSKQISIKCKTYNNFFNMYPTVYNNENSVDYTLPSIPTSYIDNTGKYTFLGYTTSTTDTSTYLSPGDTLTINANNPISNIYCVYNIKATLTYTNTDDTTYQTATVTKKGIAGYFNGLTFVFSLLSKSAPAGYTFNGWLDGTTLRQPNSSLTLYTSNLAKTLKEKLTEILVTNINITSTHTEVLVGDTEQLTANITPSNALNKTITWTSSDPETATVDENGLVTMLKTGNVTITAKNTNSNISDTIDLTGYVNTINVTYNYAYNGGTAVNNVTSTVYNQTDAIDLTPTATKSNYTFVGWNTDKDATVGLESLTAGQEDIILYAIYKRVITINYHTYDSTKDYTSEEVFYNNDDIYRGITFIEYPSELEHSNYVFMYYTNNSTAVDRIYKAANSSYTGSSENYNINNTAPDEIDFYCVYTVNSRIIYKNNDNSTYVTDSKSLIKISISAIDSVFSYIIKNKPVPTGYIFNGWTYKDNNNEVYTFIADDVLNTSNYNNTLDYTLIEDTNEILVDTVTVTPATKKILVGSTTNLSAEVIPETALDKSIVWSSSNEDIATVDQTGKVTAIAKGTVTITAKNTKSNKSDTTSIICYTTSNLHYDYTTNGGTSLTDSDNTESADYEEDDVVNLTATAEKDGWTFVGWNTDATATTAMESITFEETDITVYAIFKKDLTVTYHTYDSNNNYTSTHTLYNTDESIDINLASYDIAEHNIYTYLGYSLANNDTTNIKTTTDTITINSDIDVYCVYSKAVTLTYKDVNGEIIETVDKTTKATGNLIESAITTFTIKDRQSADGYLFDGWDANGDTSKLYHKDDSYSINGCEVTFNEHRSEIIVESVEINQDDMTLWVNSNTTLTATVTPDNALDTDIDWSSSDETIATVNNQGVVTTIKPGTVTISALNSNSNESDDIEITVKALNITYNYTENGGTSIDDIDEVYYKPENAIDLSITATKPDWTFVGWNTDKTATTALTGLISDENDITLYAIYKKDLNVDYHTYDNTKDWNDTVTIYNKETSKNTTLNAYPTSAQSNIYEFKGYTLNNTITTNLKNASDEITVPIDGLDVYCVYSKTGTLSYKKDTTEINTDTNTQIAVAEDIVDTEFEYTVKEYTTLSNEIFNGWTDNISTTKYQKNDTYNTTNLESTLYTDISIASTDAPTISINNFRICIIPGSVINDTFAKLYYRINDSDWQEYIEPFVVSGIFTVDAYQTTTNLNLESEVSSINGVEYAVAIYAEYNGDDLYLNTEIDKSNLVVKAQYPQSADKIITDYTIEPTSITAEDENTITIKWTEYPDDINCEELTTTVTINGKEAHTNAPNIHVSDTYSVTITPGSITNDTLNKIYYRIDEGAWTEYTEAIKIIGKQKVEAYQTTTTRNKESEVVSETITEYASSITAVYNGEALYLNESVDKSDVVVTAHYPNSEDKTVTNFDLNPIMISDEGNNTVYVMYKEYPNDDNSEILRTSITVVGKEAHTEDPTITISDTHNVTITAGEVTNDELDKVYYKVNDGDWIEYTAPFTLTGIYEVKAYQTTKVRNKESNIVTRLGKEYATSITAEYSGDDLYIDTDINKSNITVTAHYPNSDDKVIIDYTISPAKVNSEGNNTITITYKEYANDDNSPELTTTIVITGKEAHTENPTITIDNYMVSIIPGTIINDTLAKLFYRINSGNWTEYTDTFPIIGYMNIEAYQTTTTRNKESEIVSKTETEYPTKIVAEYIGDDKYIGDTISKTDIKVTASYPNSNDKVITNYTITGNNTISIDGINNITIKYNEYPDDANSPELTTTLNIMGKKITTESPEISINNYKITINAGNVTNANVNKIYYRINNNDWIEYTTPFKVYKTYKVEAYQDTTIRTINSEIVSITGEELPNNLDVNYIGGNKLIGSTISKDDFVVKLVYPNSDPETITDYTITPTTISNTNNSITVVYNDLSKNINITGVNVQTTTPTIKTDNSTAQILPGNTTNDEVNKIYYRLNDGEWTEYTKSLVLYKTNKIETYYTTKLGAKSEHKTFTVNEYPNKITATYIGSTIEKGSKISKKDVKVIVDYPNSSDEETTDFNIIQPNGLTATNNQVTIEYTAYKNDNNCPKCQDSITIPIKEEDKPIINTINITGTAKFNDGSAMTNYTIKLAKATSAAKVYSNSPDPNVLEENITKLEAINIRVSAPSPMIKDTINEYTATVDKNGNFTLKNVAPGDYNIYVYDTGMTLINTSKLSYINDKVTVAKNTSDNIKVEMINDILSIIYNKTTEEITTEKQITEETTTEKQTTTEQTTESNNKTNTDKNNTSTTINTVKTGDTAPIFIITIIGSISLLGLIILLFMKRKHK